MAISVTRIVQALIVGVVVWLVCIFLGMILTGTGAPPVDTIASFLTIYAWLFGILAALGFYFFGGRLSIGT